MGGGKVSELSALYLSLSRTPFIIVTSHPPAIWLEGPDGLLLLLVLMFSLAPIEIKPPELPQPFLVKRPDTLQSRQHPGKSPPRAPPFQCYQYPSDSEATRTATHTQYSKCGLTKVLYSYSITSRLLNSIPPPLLINANDTYRPSSRLYPPGWQLSRDLTGHGLPREISLCSSTFPQNPCVIHVRICPAHCVGMETGSTRRKSHAQTTGRMCKLHTDK